MVTSSQAAIPCAVSPDLARWLCGASEGRATGSARGDLPRISIFLERSWRDALGFGFVGFLLPFADGVLVHSTQGEQLLFVVDHLLAAGARQRIILHQENGFLRTNLLAKAAEDTAQHVDLKLGGSLLHIAGRGRAGW